MERGGTRAADGTRSDRASWGIPDAAQLGREVSGEEGQCSSPSSPPSPVYLWSHSLGVRNEYDPQGRKGDGGFLSTSAIWVLVYLFIK